MSSKKNEKKYIEYLQSIIENINTSHSKKYNIEAVSMLLKLPIVDNYKKQCELLLNFVKKSKNKFLKDLVKNTTNDQNICKIMVNSLYTLFYPEDFPKKSPINITEKKYSFSAASNDEIIAILLGANYSEVYDPRIITSIYYDDKFFFI